MTRSMQQPTQPPVKVCPTCDEWLFLRWGAHVHHTGVMRCLYPRKINNKKGIR